MPNPSPHAPTEALPTMDERSWTRTDYRLPTEGQVVETISPNGNPQTLKREGSLWFVPDGHMYVYYTPHFWRPLPEVKS